MATSYKVKLTFTEDVLGSIAKNKEVYAEYIAGKAALTDEALAEELETVEHVEEKGWTGFHMEDGRPLLLDYVVKGFFKGACGALRRIPNSRSQKCTAYRKIIDGLVFIYPKKLFLTLPEGAEISVVERPLRASTAQGDRVALARSDSCPAGTTMEFTVDILGGVSKALLTDWLDYGARSGIGQWRNSGAGRFRYEMSEVE